MMYLIIEYPDLDIWPSISIQGRELPSLQLQSLFWINTLGVNLLCYFFFFTNIHMLTRYPIRKSDAFKYSKKVNDFDLAASV